MAKKLNNSELRAIGFYELDLIKSAGKTAKNLIKQGVYDKEEVLALMKALLRDPEKYLKDEHLSRIAEEAIELQPVRTVAKQVINDYDLRPAPLPYPVYGAEGIEDSAMQQMNNAMRLPVSKAGALMPDAHHGYGLPIGGVLATDSNVIIPYAVGVDIACRMCLSVFEMESSFIEGKKQQLKNFLVENTIFGIDGRFKDPMDDDMFDKPEWKETELLRQLRKKAIAQVGTSGTGNHFVEWGIIEVTQESAELGLPPGKYVALLSHSGSRGFGANIANHYSKLAMEKTRLPKEARHLAWLDLNTEEGQEYWISMNLAGDYASANHHHIHKRMAKSLGMKPLVMVENHHNFAWKEKLPDGTEVMVHRKGATPAGKGELGIIPGSMASPGFVVRGKGEPKALSSASHGAGRLMSRTQALSTFTHHDVKEVLNEKGILLIGGDLDEAPMVYKDIFKVIEHQSELVDVLAKFTPKIVRMADPDRKRGARED